MIPSRHTPQFEGLWARDHRSGSGQYTHLNHKFSGNFVDDLVRLQRCGVTV